MSNSPSSPQPVGQPTPARPVFVTLKKVADKGTIEDHQIYEGYEVEGWIKSLPVVNQRLTMLRTVRNGVQRLGIFQTSPVEEISSQTKVPLRPTSPSTIRFATQNSVYLLTLYPDREMDEVVYRLIDELVNP